VSGQPIDDLTNPTEGPWYRGITRYQWMVLIIASLGWVFDVFEGQIFVASMNEAMPSLVPPETSKGTIDYYKNITLAAFLLGGATGGVLFGMLSDRIGRKKTMSLTIIMYSLFTCVSAFSTEWWHMAVFRFLVAMGVGGEWAVASAMVAEEFPKKARARVAGIFHASSVLGTYLAIATATFFIGNEAIHAWAKDIGYPSAPWRIGFGVGVLPALLIIWIRRSLKEPESWVHAKSRSDHASANDMGRLRDLFRGELLLPTFVGVSLAAVGLATFWGVHIYGKDLLRRAVEQQALQEAYANVSELDNAERAEILKPHLPVIKRWEMLGMFLVTTGGGVGLLCFGPLCERIGRRSAFLLFHLGGLAIALLCFQIAHGNEALIVLLPIFGFLTLGMHAGYAIYFPELYPTRLRGTGAGFCFNFGRILAAPILIIAGKMQTQPVPESNWWDNLTNTFALGYSLEKTASILSGLFLLGVVVLVFAPETKGKELPQ
jgi:MFS family permease